MTPIAIISGLSSNANDRILSITIEDNAGVKSDSCTVTLDDRDYLLAWPPTGAIFTVQMGYKETGVMMMGTYELDEVGHKENPARTMVIKAHAQTHTASNIKQPRTQPWDEQTLGDIVSAIASRNGYAPDIHGSLASIWYDHLDQAEESDAHLLTRLAEQYDAYAKYQDGKLLFYPRDITNGSVTVHCSDMPQWRGGDTRTIASTLDARVNTRNEYKSVKACWTNQHDNERVYEIVGSGDPQFEIRRPYESRDKAKRAAAAKFSQLARGTGTINNLTIPGDPNIRAEMDMTLVDFRPELCAIPWVVTSATHTLDNSGYKTTVRAEHKGPKGGGHL